MRDGSSGTRRGGFTNLSVAAEDEDSPESEDFEEVLVASAAISLERRRAVLFALGTINASDPERNRAQRSAMLTSRRREEECMLVVAMFNSWI